MDKIKKLLLVGVIVLVGAFAIQVLFFGGIAALMWFDEQSTIARVSIVACLYAVVGFLFMNFVHGWTGRSWRWMSRRLRDRRVRFIAV